MSNILDEFLVALGWKVDEAGARRAETTASRVSDTIVEGEKRASEATVAGTAKRIIQQDREAGRRTKGAAEHIEAEKKRKAAQDKAAKDDDKRLKDRVEAEAKAEKSSDAHRQSFILGLAAVSAAASAAAVGVVTAIVKISSSMEQVYYASQRTKSSAANLQAFGFAAGQLGSSAEEAIGTVETLSRKMKESPGWESAFNSLGVKTRGANKELLDGTKITLDLVEALNKLPQVEAIARADAYGIPRNLLDAGRSPDLRKWMERRREQSRMAGLDPDEAAKNGSEFIKVWQDMLSGLDVLTIKIGDTLARRFGGTVQRFTDTLLRNSDKIVDVIVKIGQFFGRLLDGTDRLIAGFNNLDPSTRQFLTWAAGIGAVLLFLGSSPLVALLAFGAGIVALYEDYRAWKDGSKDTLVDWDKWGPPIEKALAALKDMWERFDGLTKALTGSDGLTVALGAFAAVLALKVLGPLTSLVGLLRFFVGFSPPQWLLAMLGIGAAMHAKTAMDKGGLPAGVDPITGSAPGEEVGSGLIAPGQEGGGLRWLKEKWKNRPAILGGSGGGGGSVGRAKQNENSAAVMDELKKAGYGNNAVAAAMGSMQQESSFNPRAHNSVKGGHDGLWQWDQNRWPKIKSWIENQKGDPYDARWQTKAWIAEHDAKPGDPLYDHPKTAEAGRIFRSNPTLDEAMEGVRKSERYGIGEEGNRGANARGWLPHVDGTAGAGSSGEQQAGDVAPKDGVGGVLQRQSGARHRPQPITDTLRGQLAAAAREAGVNAEVYSGGQDSHGLARHGSHRHDNGQSADLKLFVTSQDGKRRYLSMNNDADRTAMEKFIRESVRHGANGVGSGPGYMGESGIHIGGGSPAAWGKNGQSAYAPEWVTRAHQNGMRDRTQNPPKAPASPTAATAPTWSDVTTEGLKKLGQAADKTANRFDHAFEGLDGSPGMAKRLGWNAEQIERFRGSTLGTTSVNNEANRTINNHINTNTTIQGVSDPAEAVKHNDTAVRRRHSDLIGNLGSAIA